MSPTPNANFFGLLALALFALLNAPTAFAANVTKLNTTSMSANTSNWSAAPGTNDIGEFTATPLAATMAGLTLGGADLTLAGLQFDGTMTGPATIGSGNTLTLRTNGINMSAANQNVTNQCNLSLAAGTGPIFNIASGRTLALNTGSFTRGSGAVLNIQGSGVVVPTMAGFQNSSMVNGIIGPWATFGTSTSQKYATIASAGAAVTGLTGTTAATAAAVTDTTGTVNYDCAAGGTLGSGASFNTLHYTGSAATLAGNFTANGMLLSAAVALTFTNVTIGSTKELVLIAPGAATYNCFGTFTSTETSGDNMITVNMPSSASAILNFGGGANSLQNFYGTLEFGNSACTVKFRDGGGVVATDKNMGNATVDLGVGSAAIICKTAANGAQITETIGALKGGASTTLAGSDNGGTATYTYVVGGLGTDAQFDGVIGTHGIANAGGTEAITKQGSGTWTLTGVNTYAGATTISAGTLTISGSGTLGSGSYAGAIANTGTLNYNSSASQTFSGGISGSGGALQVNAGTLTLSTVSPSYTGNTTIGGNGTLTLATGMTMASPKIQLNGGNGTFNFSADASYSLSGVTWSGSGSISGPVGGTTAASSTIIYPNGNGTAANTLTIKSPLTLDPSTTVEFDLSGSGTGNNDKFVMSGASSVLTSSSATITVNATTALDTANDYVLIDTASGGSISGTFSLNLTGVAQANPSYFSLVQSGTQIRLHYQAAGSPPSVGTVGLTPGSPVYVGTSVSAAAVVSSSGTGLGWQWQSSTTTTDGTNGTWANIGGATGSSSPATYSPSTASAGTTWYRLVATDSNGSSTNGGAQLTVVAPTVVPVVGAAVISPSGIIYLGNSPTFSASVTTNDATITAFKWQSSTNGNTWSDIPGATSATYNISSAATTDTKQYRLVAQNSVGWGYGGAVQLTVYTALISSTVNNGSFESGSGSVQIGSGNVPNWLIWSNAATAYNCASYASGLATDGTRDCYMQGGSAIYNLTTNTINAGNTYTYTWDFINKYSVANNYGTAQLGYWNGSGIVAISGTANSVTNSSGVSRGSMTWTVPAGSPAIGNQIVMTMSIPSADNYPEVDNFILAVIPASLATGPSGPEHLTNSYSAGALSFSWPANEGWRLQMQTNSLSTGLNTNWTYITDGSTSSTNITVDPTKPTVFYRLAYP